MKAIVMTKFGPPDVLQLREVEDPIPKDREVRIRIHATTASTGDCELRGLRVPFALKIPMRIYVGLIRPKPTILGQELAGEIDSVGGEVTRFKKGEQVIGWSGFALGAYAEYACMPEAGAIAMKPSNISYEQAAPLPLGGLEAVYFLRKARIKKGQEMLIAGAGGSIGSFSVQIAKYYGAVVTAVDSTGKMDMLRSIGADRVIDYTREDFTLRRETYDVIFDTAGKASFPRCMRMLRPNGRFLMGNPRLSHRIRGGWASFRTDKKVIPWAQRTPAEYADDFRFLTELVEAGKVRSVIDRCYPLAQAAEAHKYVDTGQKKGNVVIALDGCEQDA